MTAPYANATVEAELRWGGVSEEFETRVKIAAEKAAKTAQKYFDRIKLAANVTLKADTALFKSETQARLDKLRLTANVKLKANTTEFRRETQTALDKMRLTANVTLKADTAQFRAAVQNLADVRVRVTLDVGPIQPVVRDIESRLRAARIVAPVFLEVANEAQFRAHIATLTQTVTQHVNIVTHGGGGPGGGGAGAGARSLDLSLGNIAKKGLKIAGIAAMIAAIGGAAGIAAGAVGVLVGGLGAIGAAGAAGMATTLVGMQGIGDAFSAFSAQTDSAASDGEAQAKAIAAAQKGVEQANRGVEDANRGVESAERGVARANKDSQGAQKDLTQARQDAVRQIEDLNFALKGTAIDERDAELALARAREAYDKTFADPKASALDRAEAALGIDKALRRQEETLIRNADIEKEAQDAAQKGVEGSDKVVAAKEKVADAAEGVADAERGLEDAHRSAADANDAVIEANEALQDAMSGTSGAADKTAQALAKLSPNARSFVLAMRDLGPAWTEVRKSVQDNMFAGLDASFTSLATTSMPMLKEGMGQVGTSINGAAKEFASFFESSAAQDSLRNIFAGTADLITGMQPGLKELTGGILDIGNAAAPVMGQLGASLGGLLGDIGLAFTDAFESGAMTELISNFSSMLDGLGGGLNALLGGLIEFGNIVGPILGPLFQVLGESIAALAPSLGQLGVLFGEALIQVLPILSQFVSALADGLGPILPILADLIGSLGAALTPLIAPLSQIIQVVGTALVQAVDALAPAIGPLGEAFAALVTALAPILPLIAEVIGMLVSALAPALTTIFEAFAPVIQQLVDQLRPVFEQLAPVIAQIAGVLGDVLGEVIAGLAPILSVLVTALGSILTAVTPLIEPLMNLALAILEPLLNLFVQLTPVIELIAGVISDVLAQAVEMLVPILEQLAPMFGEIASLLADSLMQVIQALARLIPPLADAFMRVMEALLPLLPVIVQLALSILPPLVDIIMALMPAITGVIEIGTMLVENLALIVGYIVPVLIPAIELLGSIFSTAIDGIAKVLKWWIDEVIVPVFDRVKGAIGAGRDFIRDAVDNIKGFFTGMGETIGKVWDGVVSGIKTAVGTIGRLLQKVPDSIGIGPAKVNLSGVSGLGDSLVAWSEKKASGGVVAGQRSNGVLFGPGTGTSDDILGLSAAGLPTARVAAGEMLVNKVQTDRNLPLLTAINAGWTPSADMVRALVYGSGLPTFADGGVVGGLTALVKEKFPALEMTSGLRSGDSGHHGSGTAADFSNGSGNTDEQLALANYMADNHKSKLKELIYDDPRFDRQIKNGEFVDKAFYAQAGDHTHHVHIATDESLTAAGESPTADGVPQDGPDNRTNKEKYVDEIIGEGKKRGMSDKQIKAAIMTMLAESGGQMYANESDPESMNYAHDAVGSDHDSSGLFQQRNNGAWGTVADRMDAAKSSGMFYEELAKQDESGKTEAQLAQSVQRSAFSDGSNYAAKESEAESLIAESNARGNGTSSGASSSSPTDAGSAQQVFVTNWPSGMGGSSSSAVSSAATAASYSSGTTTTSPSVAAAAAGTPSTAFDPNNAGYDDTYYNDTVARGGKEGADAWLGRQDFAPDIREWGVNALKEIGGEFAAPLGLGGHLNSEIDKGAKEYMLRQTVEENARKDAQIHGGGERQMMLAENVTFVGMDPNRVRDEVMRAMANGLSVLKP